MARVDEWELGMEWFQGGESGNIGGREWAGRVEMLAPWPDRIVRQGMFPRAGTVMGRYFVEAISQNVDRLSEVSFPYGTLCPSYFCLKVCPPLEGKWPKRWAIGFNAVAMDSLVPFVEEGTVNFYLRLLLPQSQQQVLHFKDAQMKMKPEESGS